MVMNREHSDRSGQKNRKISARNCTVSLCAAAESARRTAAVDISWSSFDRAANAGVFGDDDESDRGPVGDAERGKEQCPRTRGLRSVDGERPCDLDAIL